MTDKEQTMEEARRLSDELGQQAEQFIIFQLHNPSPECLFPRNRFATKIADALLKNEMRAKIKGIRDAGAFCFVQSCSFNVDDPRRQVLEWAAAQLDLHASDLIVCTCGTKTEFHGLLCRARIST